MNCTKFVIRIGQSFGKKYTQAPAWVKKKIKRTLEKSTPKLQLGSKKNQANA